MHRVVAELEGFGQEHAVGRGGLDHAGALGRGGGDRLLDEDGPHLSRLGRPDGDPGVAVAPGADRQGVEVLLLEHLPEIGVAAGDLELVPEALQGRLGDVAQGDEVDPAHLARGAGVGAGDASRAKGRRG